MNAIRLFGCVVMAVSVFANGTQASPILVAYYNMEETAGPTLHDQSSTGALATETETGGGSAGFLYGQPGVPAGTYGAITTASTGYAAELTNATSQWNMNTAGSQAMSLTNNFTVMAWVYMPRNLNGTEEETTVIGQAPGWFPRGWTLCLNNSSGQAADPIRFTGDGIADYFSTASVDWTGGQWHNIAVTKSSSSGITFYVDGNVLGSVLSSATGNFNALSSGDVMCIGNNSAGTDKTIPGTLLNEVRVYNGVLTQSQIIAAATVVPEPSTLALLAAGLVGLLAYAWRKRR